MEGPRRRSSSLDDEAGPAGDHRMLGYKHAGGCVNSRPYEP